MLIFLRLRILLQEIFKPIIFELKQERTRRRRRSRKKDKKDMVGRDNEQTQNLGVTQSFKSSPRVQPFDHNF